MGRSFATVPRGLPWEALLLAVCLPLAGCNSPPKLQTPRDALRTYAQAVNEERYDDAYELLSAETRGRLSRQAFMERLRDHPDEVTSLLREVVDQGEASQIRATITGVDGETLELIFEGGAWKLEASALELYPQTEVGEALTSFVRAYDRNRYDILLRFVPDSQLVGMDEKVLRTAWEGEQKAEMDAVVEGIRVSLANPRIELVGERATMAYEGDGTVELVLEQGVWKIEDFK